MNFKEVVKKAKKRLERVGKYHIDICCVCPFHYKDCVKGITHELKKEK